MGIMDRLMDALITDDPYFDKVDLEIKGEIPEEKIEKEVKKYFSKNPFIPPSEEAWK